MKIKKQMQKGLSLAIYRFTERERQQIADREREREVNLVLVVVFTLVRWYVVVVFGDRRNRLLKRKLTGRMAV